MHPDMAAIACARVASHTMNIQGNCCSSPVSVHRPFPTRLARGVSAGPPSSSTSWRDATSCRTRGTRVRGNLGRVGARYNGCSDFFRNNSGMQGLGCELQSLNQIKLPKVRRPIVCRCVGSHLNALTFHVHRTRCTVKLSTLLACFERLLCFSSQSNCTVVIGYRKSTLWV